MKSAWNLVGMLFWIIVIGYLCWMIHDMRARRLKLIVTKKKSFSKRNLWQSIIELVIFLAAFVGMSYTTFFRDVSKLDPKQVTVAYQYQPLIMRYDKQSYYVAIHNRNGRQPIQEYTYYTPGKRVDTSSYEATIVYGKRNLNVPAEAYKWDKAQLNHLDVRYQRAWVGSVVTTYKKNFINGIGLHAGRQANRFNLVRVPDKSFIQGQAR